MLYLYTLSALLKELQCDLLNTYVRPNLDLLSVNTGSKYLLQ